MAAQERRTFAWMDLLWLVFLAGLAALDPIFEIHKQLTLLGIGLFQIFERQFIKIAGPRGPAYSVLIKIGLATLLVSHTGGINSSYYPIYYLPAITAAMDFGALQTLLWTALASLAYCSHLIPALMEYSFPEADVTELVIRNLFIFLAALVVNRIVMENRRQSSRYQALAETLADTNRRLEDAQAEARRSDRLAALGQLSAGLAHEVRNPLGVIKGSAEMLHKVLKTDEALSSELANNISSEVNRLNALISRFLDFARPTQIEKHPESIPALVDRALKAVHDRWPDAAVAVERHYAANLPKVPVDAQLFEQVFTNLFLNAYEAVGSGGGKIRVSISEAKETAGIQDGDRGRQGVIVEIEDNGPGIPGELRDQIFNPFFTTKPTGEGTGLGLSLSYDIINAHGGNIKFDTKENDGTDFIVYLPA